MAFDLDSYEPVQSRFSRFIEWASTREEFFAVVSEMLSAPGADICVFKTSILMDGVTIATGHAEEVRGQGNVNRTSHVENGETSSLGRCLSNFPLHNFCGTSVDKRPSREEMSKVQRMTTSTSDAGVTTIQPSDKASDKQLNMIRAVSKSMGIAVPSDMGSFSKKRASAYIDQLKNPQPNDVDVSEEEPF
jgi:hypothetical protein